jgi:predicted Ser/Thr protein kinase
MNPTSESSIIFKDLTVKGLIGKGAFSEVFLGTTKGQQQVALKKIYSSNKKSIENDISTLMYVFHREFTHILVLFDINIVSDSLDCMCNQTIHLTL